MREPEGAQGTTTQHDQPQRPVPGELRQQRDQRCVADGIDLVEDERQRPLGLCTQRPDEISQFFKTQFVARIVVVAEDAREMARDFVGAGFLDVLERNIIGAREPGIIALPSQLPLQLHDHRRFADLGRARDDDVLRFAVQQDVLFQFAAEEHVARGRLAGVVGIEA